MRANDRRKREEERERERERERCSLLMSQFYE
jgi:hypothetical protein